MIGQRIANYRLEALLGQGGMGSVYRAHHLTLERDDAIKIMASHLSGDEFTRRFQREARMMARLDHPNIVRVFDCGEVNSISYIVMELLQGETLRDRLEHGPVGEAETARIAYAMLSALAGAHAQGIIHRDMKPANIFLCANGNIKVLDFGIAKAVSEARLTTGGMQMGTLEYISPEQAQGFEIDGRTDLYSVGVMMYEMLTGHVPFTADTPLSILHMHITRPLPPLPPTVSPWMRGLVERALAKDPNHRFPTAAEMGNALANPPALPAPPQMPLMGDTRMRQEHATVLSGSPPPSGPYPGYGQPYPPAMTPPPVYPTPTPYPPPVAAKGNRRALWTGGGIVAALGIGTALFFAFKPKSPEPLPPPPTPPVSQTDTRAESDTLAQDAYHLLLREKRADCAVKAREAIVKNPNNALAHALLGKALEETYGMTRKESDLAEAEKEINQALQLDPKCAMAHVGKSGLHYDNHRMADALKESNQAIALDPKLAYAYDVPGLISLSQNRYQDAETAFLNAIRLEPEIVSERTHLAFIYNTWKQYTKAEEMAQEEIKLGSPSADTYYQLGISRGMTKRWQEAADAYSQAIRLNPDNGYYHLRYAEVLYNLGRKSEAHDEAATAKRLGATGSWVFEKVGV